MSLVAAVYGMLGDFRNLEIVANIMTGMQTGVSAVVLDAALGMTVTVFREKNGVWHREDGIESERSYGEKALKNALGKCGMEIVDISGGYDFSKPDEHCKRWYITAKKVRNIR